MKAASTPFKLGTRHVAHSRSVTEKIKPQPSTFIEQFAKKIKRFSWECDDGAESGSKCRKSCDRDLGWQFTLASWQTPRTEIQCICRGTCKWAGSTHVCKRSGCTKPPNFPFVSDPGKFSFHKLKNSKKIMNK